MKEPRVEKKTDGTWQRRISGLKASFKTRSFRVGGYSIAATAIVLAIAIVVNVFANALPASVTQFDTTSNQLFSISDQTEKLLAGLDEEITIYWIVQADQEDETLQLLLERYAALSSKISVVKRDPDVYPTFLQTYDLDTVYNNSLVVESGERFRYVDYYDIYTYDTSDYYTTGSYDTSFSGENALTSAIDYVTSDSLQKIYMLTGHGESELASTFESAVQSENIELETLSLLTVEAIPDDADALFIYAPQSDLTEQEKEMIAVYLQAGGNMILITNPPQEETLTNLEALMADYGVTAAEGIVVEGSQSNYVWGTPYYLLPELKSHAITSPLTENGYFVLLPIAQGLTVGDPARETISVTELLTTSDSAFSKISGYEMTTYDREEGDLDGPFALAVAITETVDDENETNIVWVSSSALLDEQTNAEVSGGNQDFFLNAISWMCEQEESISIHAKSMNYTYLTIDSATSSALTALVVGVLPLCYLATGVWIWVRRKRR
jgi:ABC-2 type transport system permease protein